MSTLVIPTGFFVEFNTQMNDDLELKTLIYKYRWILQIYIKYINTMLCHNEKVYNLFHL